MLVNIQVEPYPVSPTPTVVQEIDQLRDRMDGERGGG